MWAESSSFMWDAHPFSQPIQGTSTSHDPSMMMMSLLSQKEVRVRYLGCWKLSMELTLQAYTPRIKQAHHTLQTQYYFFTLNKNWYKLGSLLHRRIADNSDRCIHGPACTWWNCYSVHTALTGFNLIPYRKPLLGLGGRAKVLSTFERTADVTREI